MGKRSKRWPGIVIDYLVLLAACAALAQLLALVEARLPKPVFNLGFWGYLLFVGLPMLVTLSIDEWFARLNHPRPTSHDTSGS